MHRLHDVWQFSETSLKIEKHRSKHRIVKNWKTSHHENIASLRKIRHRPPLALISTKGALRLPTTYDNPPILSIHPPSYLDQGSPVTETQGLRGRSTYSCEDDLSIKDLIEST